MQSAQLLWLPHGLPHTHRQQDLYRILKAYTIYRPDEGYCQAQAPVAAVLLMHMPAEVSTLGRGLGVAGGLGGHLVLAGVERLVLAGGIFCPILRPQHPSHSRPSQQAFWCLVQICDKYLPGYYSAGLVSVWRLGAGAVTVPKHKEALVPPCPCPSA